MASGGYNAEVAAEVAEENFSLHKRLAKMEWEGEQQRRAAEYEAHFEESVDTTGVDRARRKNNALREEIAALETQLKSLQTINVAELQHEYQRLDSRRAHLLNEIASLRRVIANQSKDVRRATRAVNGQQELRRQNDEQHASLNADIFMFKDKRESLAKETQRLIRKERKLELELRTLPAPGEDYEAAAARLREDNTKKARTVARLEAALRDEQQPAEDATSAAGPVEDLQQLREEYVQLNDQLKQRRR